MDQRIESKCLTPRLDVPEVGTGQRQDTSPTKSTQHEGPGGILSLAIEPTLACHACYVKQDRLRSWKARLSEICPRLIGCTRPLHRQASSLTPVQSEGGLWTEPQLSRCLPQQTKLQTNST